MGIRRGGRRGGYGRRGIGIRFRDAVYRAVSPMLTYSIDYGTTVTTVVNQCQWLISGVLYSGTDINNMVGAGPLGTTKVVYETGKMNMRVTNMCEAVVVVRAYYCISRYDYPAAGASLSTLLTNGFTSSGYAGALTDPSSTIYQCADFVQQFRVYKQKTIQLDPGAVAVYSLQRNTPFSPSTAMIKANLYNFWRGISKFVLFQFYSASAAGDIATPNLIGIPAVKLGFLSTEKYEYRFQPILGRAWTHATSGLNALAGGAQIVDDDTGLVQALHLVN